MTRQFRMGAAKAAAAEAALIEDADQIDHDVLAAEALAQLRFLVHIAILEGEPGSTSKCLCCSRSRDSAVTRWPSLIRRATSRVPKKPGAAENDDG